MFFILRRSTGCSSNLLWSHQPEIAASREATCVKKSVPLKVERYTGLTREKNPRKSEDSIFMGVFMEDGPTN